MSNSKRPLVADVIPLFDLIERQLINIINDLEQPTIIRTSAAKARAVMNKYYNKSDDSRMYRLCMSKLHFIFDINHTKFLAVLHLKYKMMYFHKEQWESAWIDVARDMLRYEWETFYKPLIHPSFLEESTIQISNVGVYS